MNRRVFNAISGRLSLRPPQSESMERLARAIDVAPDMLKHERDLTAVLTTLKAEFSTLEAFEREFPSLCFALATGVGKTRLMGAFVGYLHLAYGFKHFFVLAPNLTIYNKLIADFTPNTPKYVFRGIAEFAAYPPEIITGDNYEQRAGNLSLLSPVTVNIFNISKINSEVRGGKSPRIKRLSEYLGDSSKTGKAEEEMIERLLAVESEDEPTEIVIHVNMLKEGWDVTNLYTIVPLRAANARTLIEQSIGRGLRLPYGKRTGVSAVDRLNIVAHDRFQEIIDEANRGDSPIRLQQVILEAPDKDEGVVSVQVGSAAEVALGLTEPRVTGRAGKHYELKPEGLTEPLFASEAEKRTARAVMDVIHDMEKQQQQVPSSAALAKPEVRQAILDQVKERLTPVQAELLEEDEVDLASVVAKITEIVTDKMIDIPRIAVIPTGEVTVGFDPFTLDLSGLHLQPADRELVIHHLHSNEQETLASEVGITERRLEDYIVYGLVDYDDIDYHTHAELLYDLAGQMVRHLLTYLSEDETTAVLDRDRRLIAENIHAQMMAHFWEKVAGYEVKVSRGFTRLKPCNYTASARHPIKSYRETVTDRGRIKKTLFCGFGKCLYPLQKFDSDSERRFAVILERGADKWFRPVKGQFQIFYKLGAEQPEYVPDFVAETEGKIYMVETKARGELNDPEVLAKADAATKWCGHAMEYAQANGGKPWQYLLIPHDEINESRRIDDFERFEKA